MTDGVEPVDAATNLAVGETGPEIVVEDLERKDFVQYAGASGDFNPIHYDEPFADAAGYDSVFGQGMLTAGFAAQAVTHWFGIEHVRSFGVRFQAQVWPGDTVTAVAEVTEIETEDGTATVEATIDVTNQDGETVLSGDATAELPAGE